MDQQSKFKFRHEDRLQTSHRIYEPLILSFASDMDLRNKVFQSWDGKTEEIGQSLRSYCREMLDFFGQPGEISADGKCCVFNLRARVEKINEKIKNLQKNYPLTLDGQPGIPVLEILNKRKKMLDDRIAYDGENRVRDCADFTKQEKNSGFYCFGTIDMINILPVPSAMWASAFRMCYALPSMVSGLFGLPMHRIKSVRELKDRQANEDARNLLPTEPGRFIAYTFIHKPKVEFKLGGEHRAQFLLYLCRFFLPYDGGNGERMPAEIEVLMNRGNPTAYQDAKIELFLTMSVEFPIMIKSEFTNIEDLSRFLTWIGDELPIHCRDLAGKPESQDEIQRLRIQTSTTLGWWDPDFREGKPSDLRADEEATFQMLVKCEIDPDNMANDIARRLNQALSKDGKPVVLANQIALSQQQEPRPKGQGIGKLPWYTRPYYWDVMITFRTDRVSRLMQLLADDIRELTGVVHAATMPLLTAGFDSKVDFTRFSKEDFENANLYPEVMKAEQKRKKIEEEKDLVKHHLEIWRKRVDYFPACFRGLDRDDPLVDRYIKYTRELRTLYSYAIQLEESWTAQVRLRTKEPAAYDEKRLHRGTFQSLQSSILKKINFLDGLESFLEKKYVSTTNQAYHHSKTLDPDLDLAKVMLARFRQKWWVELEDTRILCTHYKKILLDIAAEFRNRTESHQIIHFTEHAMKVGEQAGVLDLTIEAVGRLFRRYCGEPDSTKVTKGFWEIHDPHLEALPVLPGETKQDDKPQRYDWRGLFISSTYSDYYIIPEVRLLYLPMDLRFSTKGKIVVVAHEAGHQDLYTVWQNQGKDLNADPDPRTVAGAFSIWWNRFLDGVRDHWDDLRPIIGPLENQYNLGSTISEIRHMEWHRVEFLADLFGLLSAGPAFIRELMHFLAVPANAEAKLIEKEKKYLAPAEIRPAWLRIAVLYLVAKQLRWFSQNDSFGIEPLVRDYFAHHETLYGSQTLYDVLNSADLKLDLLLYQWISEQNRKPGPFLPILLFLRTEAGYIKLRELILWFHRFGSKFLFYPLFFTENIDEPTATQIEKAWKDYPLIIDYINEYCASLYDRVVYNDEVLLDAPLRYIAAASAMDSNPGRYSAGRLLHSLYYSDWMTGYQELMGKINFLMGNRDPIGITA